MVAILPRLVNFARIRAGINRRGSKDRQLR
jgi:hypothetical protein